MLLELSHPLVGDEDALSLGVVVSDSVAFLMGVSDDVLHILIPQGTEDAKKEFSLGQLA